ncbi:hypothetical protein C4D60_Mb04t06090 [Musa balbisiana]|uniref:Uncharacterized protein n=1 Tax=Musa balbisiana TaxID=52838 RepID=A0A4S8K9Z8_MUSBA|nr:hypothetical protein C4D60_Mb04t06090 [Musa balbisiana]
MENEVEHHVVEKRVGVSALLHEGREDVVVVPAVSELQLPGLDNGRQVAVDVRDAARERGLHANLEPLVEPPDKLEENEAMEAGLGGVVEGDGRGVLQEV